MKLQKRLGLALVILVGGLAAGTSNAQTQVQHQNGLGQTFNDASPLATPGNGATYSLRLATSAAMAWPGVSTPPAQVTCTGGALAVSKQTGTSCAVWAFTRAISGHVKLNAANNNCFCPTTTDPVWR